ncbi:MAG: hypothetical protein COA78_08735 [Blastopirellula sp.]|nr:MAG: hypothetical protein COA78_08735 [Blastopirellula sp.]
MKWLPKLRFSMRTLFILVTLLCVLLVPLSVKLYQAQQQRLAVEWVRANGDFVLYDYQDGILSSNAPTDYLWLRSILGDDFFDAVTGVFIINPTITDISQLTHLQSLEKVILDVPQKADLSPLGSLKQLDDLELTFSSEKSFTAKNIAVLSKLDCSLDIHLSGQFMDDLRPIQQLNNIRHLTIADAQVTDLAPLTHLTQLETLGIWGTPVKDISALSNLSRLKRLSLYDTQINDISPLSDLTQLEELNFSGPNITDLTLLAKLVNLRELSLTTPKAKDLSPLEKLVNLEKLFLSDIQVPKVEIDKLKKALPNCLIIKY